MTENAHCTPQELANMLKQGEDFCLLDVRTDQELESASIDGCTHIPLNELPQRIEELGQWRNKTIVAMCHHGMRSEMAQEFLASHGFNRVTNLTGGIDAYAAEVDPAIGRY